MQTPTMMNTTTVGSRRSRRFYLNLVTGTLVLAGVLPAWAATLTVTNTDDSGAGSLRDTIATASPGDTIQFSVPNPSAITLTSGKLLITKDLTINGPGAARLALDGNRADRVFEISRGVTVTLSGLTIQNGTGGGIFNFGTLTLTDSTVSGNSGGGIVNYGGTATLTNSTVSNNSGGGISNEGTLTLTDSTVSGNSGGGLNSYNSTATLTNSTVSGNSDRGGIENTAGTLTLTNSTVSGNSIPGGVGGGIYNSVGVMGTVAHLTLINSTVSGNSAGFDGGGLYNEGGTATLTNSTVSGNSASGSGGGLYSRATLLTLTNSTVASNSASNGGGLYSVGGVPLTVKNTLLANNNGGNCGGHAPVSQGYNVSDDSTCAAAFTQTGDQNDVVPGAGLDPQGLQNHGGPTQTIALLPDSPAVDAIPVAACTDTSGNPVQTDQRGIARPQGVGCDVGAFELVPAVPFSDFRAHLVLRTGHPSGFHLTSWFTLGQASQGLQPLTEAVTLQIANYTVTLPAGSLHPVQKGPHTRYRYEGTVNGTHLELDLLSRDGNQYELKASGFPVTWTDLKNPVTVSLSIGPDTGSTTVHAFISPF